MLSPPMKLKYIIECHCLKELRLYILDPGIFPFLIKNILGVSQNWPLSEYQLYYLSKQLLGHPFFIRGSLNGRLAISRIVGNALTPLLFSVRDNI